MKRQYGTEGKSPKSTLQQPKQFNFCGLTDWGFPKQTLKYLGSSGVHTVMTWKSDERSYMAIVFKPNSPGKNVFTYMNSFLRFHLKIGFLDL